MRGVAADEDAAVAETVGDQAAADPVFLAENSYSKSGPTPRMARIGQSRSTESNRARRG